MSFLRPFCCDDLFRFNRVNLDYYTETYPLPFYQRYLAQWPEYCAAVEGPGRELQGYVLGKVEGEGTKWHGHVTAVTVAPTFRRQGVAARLMGLLEATTADVHKGFFVDLFVRASNASAVAMYGKLGYSVYRRVLGYYTGEEDALDMRKAMPRDKRKQSVVPLKHPIRPRDLEFD